MNALAMWTMCQFHVERLAARLGNAATIKRCRAFLGNEDGASIVIIGLTLPALIGAMGLAAEVSYWHLNHRAMQNAADAAAIAAATNGGSSYVAEAQAVAAQYGFQDGTKNVTVTVSNPSTATGCTANCYTVAISDQVPLFLSQVVGFQGNTTVSGQPASTVAASSVATSAAAYSYCLLALAGSGTQGITSNGAPKANLNGCNVMSNTSATCHGHNLNASFGDAYGTNNGCGITQNSNASKVSDPYAGSASNIPTNSCGSYPQEPAKKQDPPLPASNLWSGTENFSGNKIVCGDQQLTGDTTINGGSNGAVLIIENGQLDTNGYTLNGTNLTIVFSGSNSSSYQHTPTGGGTLNITAPTSGNWSGIAIYQDPALTTNVDISAAGNSPTWNISGLIYLPHSSVTLSGAVNKSSNGSTCFALVVDNITINGTGSIFANDSRCPSGGLTQPRGGHRGTLVN
jgi:Flp pilus assembly protein TadG